MRQETMIDADRFSTEIKSILEQLCHSYKPAKVILFGSLANGRRTHDGSDIDLFIIKDDVPYYGVDRIRQLDRTIRYGIATDFVVYTSKEVERSLKDGDPFIKSIFAEGEILYDAAA
jgi:uncharacterized protein